MDIRLSLDPAVKLHIPDTKSDSNLMSKLMRTLLF
jgi:hypothetical protein